MPVSKSAADKIDALRKMATGKFTSATYEGIYDSTAVHNAVPEAPRAARKINLE